MESLSVDNNRLSFLRSPPFSFSLYNREGPNRVEIFDITSIPSCRSAISETTCLCDIFGDDCESPTLSSSPQSGSIAKPEDNVYKLADDTPNDWSGSYHTATGSEQQSDSSETFEDSREVLSPLPPLTPASPEARGASPSKFKFNGPDLSPDPHAGPSSGTAPSPKSKAPLSLSPEPRSTNISPEDRTAVSPHNASIKLPSLEASCSNLSSEHRSVDISPKSVATATLYEHRGTAPSPEPRDTDVIYETTTITPTPEDWDILDTTALRGTEPRITDIPPEAKCTSPVLQHRVTPSKVEPSVPSLETEYKPNSLELDLRAELPEQGPTNTSPEPEPRALSAEPEPIAMYPESRLSPKSPKIIERTTSPKTELRATSPEPDTRAISPNLKPSSASPDSESRALASTFDPGVTSSEPEPRNKFPIIRPSAIYPKIEPSATSPEQEFTTPSPEPELSDTFAGPEFGAISSTLEPSATSPEPESRAISFTPERSVTSPEPESRAISFTSEPSATAPEPEFRTPSPEPELSAASADPKGETPSPDPKPRATFSEPESRAISSTLEPTATTPESETRDETSKLEPSTTSPEPEFKTPSPEPETIATSPEPEFKSPYSEPEPTDTSSEPVFRNPSPEPESSATSPEPEFKTPSPEPETIATSPEPEFKSPYSEPQPTDTSSEPVFRNPSPEPESSATSTEPEFMTPYPEPEPIATSPEPEFRNPYSEPEPTDTSPDPEFRNPSPSPEPEPSATSTEPEFRTPSAEPEHNATSLRPETRSTFPELNTIHPSPEGEITASYPKPINLEISLETKATFLSAKSIQAVIFPETEITVPSSVPIVSGLTQDPRLMDPSYEPRQNNPSPEPGSTNFSLESKTANQGLCSPATAEPPSTVISQEEDISSEPRSPCISAECKNPELFEQKGHTTEYSGTTAVFELEDQDRVLKPTAGPLKTSCPTKPHEKEGGEMATNNASKGLQPILPLFTFDMALIRPPGNKKCQVSPSKENAADNTELNRKPQEPEVSTSGESPTMHTRQGDNRQPQRDWGQREGGAEEEEERKREEQRADEGEGNRDKASNEEQQVELSFSARNRRAPVSPSSAPTCRQLRTGMPTGCYSDCLFVTQQRQQQNPFRIHDSQKENPACAKKPRLIPRPTRSSARRPAPENSSETSSMGSELDEADNEVKWFTDVAFRSLSSPQAEYLDVYNSSHRSSTNVSQLSMEDSPGASAWSAYADLRGSIRHDADNLPHMPPKGLATDRLDMTRRFEMGSFECVDVALESREDVRKGKRTVPKRQIQLKRRDTGESQVSESDETTSDAANEAAPVQRLSRDTLLRQHSTPATIQEELCNEVKPELSDRKQKLQKSLSLDETSGKTKTASGLIKSVLSKKMQQNENLTTSQPSLQSGDSGYTAEKNESSESSQSVRETPKMEGSNLSSEVPSDCSLSEEDLPVQMESAPQSNLIKQSRRVGPKPPPKPLWRNGYSPLQSGTSSLEFQRNYTGKLGMRSELVIPFESPKTEKRRETWKQSVREPEKQRSKDKDRWNGKETEKQCNKEMEKQHGSEWKLSNRGTEKQRSRDIVKPQSNENLYEKHSGDSANAIFGNTGTAATRAPGTPSGMTNRNQECYTRSENYKQQSARNIFMSKTPEITLKPCTTREKKMSSLKTDCLHGDTEPKQEERHVAPSPERLPEKETHEHKMVNKTEEHTENREAVEKSKPKAPVHKVRDVRKLVKNTYNLSFKAPAVLAQDSVSRGEAEKPLPMQIEYISRKVEGLGASRPGEGQTEGEKVQMPSQVSAQVHPQVPVQVPPQKVTQTTSLHITPRGHLAKAGTLNTEATDGTATDVSQSGSHVERIPGGGTGHPEQGTITKLPSKEREVSTLMFLQNGPTEGGLEPGALPPLALTATSCSRSVSMLLKEKGFQADIGVCDAPVDDHHAAPKHVNRLEVPLQTCSTEESPCEPLDPVPPHSRTSPSAPILPMDPKKERHSRNPTPPQLRELDLERTSQNPRENTSRTQNTTPSSPQIPAAPAMSNDRSQVLDVKAVSTCTRKPEAATAAIGSAASSCKQQSEFATAQLQRNTQRMNQPAVSAMSSYKQNPQEANLMRSDAQEQVALASSCSPSCSQSSVPGAAQSPSCLQQSAISITSTKRVESNDLHYYASDDPPSYDDRESFSPLLLTDLYSRKPNRIHPPAQAPPCACAADGVPCPGPPVLTPPAPAPITVQVPPSHTQAPPCLAAPPPARHHQQRPDARSLSYTSSSPKGAPPNLAQAPHLCQSIHHPPPGLPVFPPQLPQPRPENSRQLPPGQQVERRPGKPASLSGSSTYSSHSTHSPGVPPLEVRPQYLCTPPGFVSSYGSEYGSEGGGLYHEGGGSLGYGQSPRRVLLDPETGKYFYIEVPVQPLRKMLFDPEMGQYVEVLIPQQTLPHSSLYPPVAAPYPSMHNPGMYAPQYLPYSVPHHSQPPSPRHPEAPPPQGLHQNSGAFATPRSQSQSPKPEPHTHPPLDQSYLESMYYVPTGMTASPNPAPPEFYHKLPPSLPNSGGKRS